MECIVKSNVKMIT